MRYLQALLCSYSEIFFIPGRLPGAVILAVTLLNPNMAAAGLVAVLSAYGFARLTRMEKAFLELGYFIYNPLLVGFSLGYMFTMTPVALLFVATAGIVTLMVTVFMANVFSAYLRLPILSLPFVIVSSIAYMASARYSSLFVRFQADSGMLAGDFGLPFWIAGFLKSLGAVFFAPTVVVGIVLGIVLLRYSRIQFVLAMMGYYVGAAIRALMVGSVAQGFSDINNFNCIFIAMALGGVFLVPSLEAYLIAAIAVAISTLFTDAITGFWYYYGIPAFTLPFNVVTLGMVYLLGTVRYALIPLSPGRTPEERLANHLANRLRYPGRDRTLHLPFAGKWTVWQGCDGAWTHKGSWRYAYDFVITGEDGKTHVGDGGRLEDYHAWNKPVLSPVRGRVVQVVADLPDNPVGGADRTNNWGNVVIIEDPRGFFVELSHFAAKSIRVKKGDPVERGTLLGMCGNSGYSPQPHIHVQVQATDVVSAASLPFSFVSYTDGGEFQSNNLPSERGIVEPLYLDKRLDNITNFMIDDEVCYRVFRGGGEVGELKLKVRMAPDGTFYFESSRGQLYFGKHEGTFYFYRVTGDDRWLRLLFLALPRMPVAYRDKLAWHDYVPADIAARGVRAAAAGFLGSVYPKLAVVRVNQAFVSETRVESIVERGLFHPRRTASVELDRQKGFSLVTVGDVVLRRAEQ